MFVTKKPVSSAQTYANVLPIRPGTQLENLYARRTAVEALIQSLEDYQRFRAQRTDSIESKTA